MLGLVSLPALVFLLLTPMLHVFGEAFSYREDEALRVGVDEGTVTLEFAREVLASSLSRKLFYRPLVNTLVTGIGATVLAITVGGVLAWLLSRTDLPGKRLLGSLALVPYITPPWPIALAWIAFFQTDLSVGGKPGILQWLTGIRSPEWICYGGLPIVLVEAIHLYAYAFLLISAALERVDATLEEAAEVLGASRLSVLRRIVFPLALPSILSAAILTFGKAAGNFTTPYFVGNPVRYFTLATRLYEQVQINQVGRAAIITLALVAMTALTLEANRRALGQARRFGTVTGKGFRSQKQKLRGWRTPLAIIAAGFIVATAAIPLGILGLQSVSAEEGVYSLDNLTLQFWVGDANPAFAGGEPGILRSPAMWHACMNSVKLAVSAALLCVLLGLPLSLCIHENRSPWLSRIIEVLTFVPYMTPALAFGAVYLLLFARPIGPIPALYGTFWLLILASTAKDIPYAVRIETAALTQVSGELVDAARILGIRTSLMVRRILMPLVRPSMVAAFVMLMIGNMKELSLLILLVGPNTQILTTYVYRYQELGHRGFSAAMVVFLVAVVLTLSAIARRVKGREIATPDE